MPRQGLRMRGDLGQPVVLRSRAVEHAVLAGAPLGEQVEVVVHGLHVEGGLVVSAAGAGEGRLPPDLPLWGGPGKVWRWVGGLVAVPPLVRLARGPVAAAGF